MLKEKQNLIGKIYPTGKIVGTMIGVAGYTPQKGIDYFTEEDKKEIENETRELLSEDLQKIQTEVDDLNSDVNNLNAEIDNLDVEVERLSGNVNNIAIDVSTIDGKVTTLNEKTLKNEQDILDIEENLNYLYENKANKEDIPDVSEFITKTVNNLTNYYLKTDTYTKTQVNQLISTVKSVHFQIVDNLPEIGEDNIIYLVPKSESEFDDIYNEYIWINEAYELIGNTSIDISDIYTKEQINTMLNNYVLKADKYQFVKDGLVNNNITLTDAEKLKVETWLGLSENYLTTYNTTPYQVETNYNPAHKKYVDDNIKVLDDKVKKLELFKFPNMTIVGTPTIQNGQVSDFTLDDYLEFPFLVDFRGRPFEINFAFTTGSNVTVQQNILDSAFGLALAIKNGHTLMAISYNGTTWANQYIGTLNIEPNTTYVYRITWNGMLYRVQYYNGSQYVDDFYFAATQQPYPKQMFIGVSKLSNNYFEGSINLNYANLKVDGNVVWTGMDDAGLASRLATDLSNIDEAGIQKIIDIIQINVPNAEGVDF